MQNYTYNLSFDIMDVANILNIRIRRKGTRSVYTDCPFCGDTRGKMNLNLEKNQFRCNYCDESGGAIQLYAKVYNLSNADAYREICDTLYGNVASKNYQINKKEKLIFPESSKLASIYDRNQTYEMLLSILTLAKAHVEELKRRGISDEHIVRAGFKSTPAFGFDSIAEKLIEKGCVVEGVPGFYRKSNGQWTLNFKSACSGILIPVRDISGMIQGFQIRLDRPFEDKKGKKTKYIWFSSVEFEKGVSSGSPAHFIGDPCDETVFITEGPLKAEAAYSLSGRTFLAVAGVGNIDSLKDALEILKRNGTKTMYECYDMDQNVNEHVKRATAKLIEHIKNYGFNAKHLKWDEKYKGIDDFLLSRKNM